MPREAPCPASPCTLSQTHHPVASRCAGYFPFLFLAPSPFLFSLLWEHQLGGEKITWWPASEVAVQLTAHCTRVCMLLGMACTWQGRL